MQDLQLVKLHQLIGHPAKPEPLATYVRITAIQAIEEVVADVESADGVKKKVVCTQIVIPFCKPIIVQETIEQISGLLKKTMEEQAMMMAKAMAGKGGIIPANQIPPMMR